MNGEQPQGREALVSVASQLDSLLPRLVFVGGQVAQLLITDHAAVRIRPTKDVDVIVSATSRVDYAAMERQLRSLGFANDVTEGAPICRWVSPDGYLLDLMPVDEAILGFSNRWYLHAVERSAHFELSADLSIRIPTAPVYVATKLEAFLGRGDGDLLGSPDLEDLITVVGGRPELAQEIIKEPDELRSWLQESLSDLRLNRDFPYAIEGALPDVAAIPGYLDEIMERFESIASPPHAD